MRKKGVSPLIATVMLIAFVIILFVLVSTWTRRAALEPAMQAGEEKVASTLECAEINIDVVSACVYNTNTDLKLEVDNIGTKLVYGLKVRTVGATGVAVNEITNLNLVSLGRYISAQDAIPIGVGAVSKVEVYPMLSTGLCEGRFVSTSTITTGTAYANC